MIYKKKKKNFKVTPPLKKCNVFHINTKKKPFMKKKIPFTIGRFIYDYGFNKKKKKMENATAI